MRVFILFLISSFVIGFFEPLDFVRRRRMLLLMFAAMFATSFYSLRIIL